MSGPGQGERCPQMSDMLDSPAATTYTPLDLSLSLLEFMAANHDVLIQS